MVKIAKGGRGPIGSKVKAPHGKYIHERQASPKKYTRYKTVKRKGKLLRLGYNPRTKKWEVQSVLTPD